MGTAPAWGVALRALALSLWTGGGIAVVLATRAVFALSATRREAGKLSGAILLRFRALQIGACALLAASALLGASGSPSALGAAAAALFLASLPIDGRLRRLRAELGGSTDQLPPEDPRRGRFAALHAVSVLLFLGQIACAAAALVVAVEARPPQ